MTPRRSATKSPTPARSSSAPHTPEAIGDYVGGSNHVLPTARSAPLLVGPRRPRLHEAHVAAQMRRPLARGSRPGGDRRWARPRGSRRTRARSRCGFARIAHERANRPRAAIASPRSILDEATIPRGAADVDHERTVAIFDLIEENSFGVPGRDDGPYALKISQEESKLTFEVRTANGETAASIVVSMTPFRPLLKDYFLVCETYYSAIRTASPRQIEAIDRERTTAAQRRRRAHGPAARRHGRHRPGDGPAPVRAGFGFALAGVIPRTR